MRDISQGPVRRQNHKTYFKEFNMKKMLTRYEVVNLVTERAEREL